MLLLDAEALSALSHGPAQRRQRVRALVAEMRGRELPVATVAAILAEVVRGRPQDAEVLSCLRRDRVAVIDVDRRVGIRAGQLLGVLSVGSELAVGAFLVAAADLAGGAVIASTGEDDLRSLASYASRIVIAPISA